MEKKKKIFTHEWVDIDAVASLWFALRFMLEEQDVEILFVPASWNGIDLEPQDLALDISAGGKGIKGRMYKGKVHSCFEELVSRHADRGTKRRLSSLVRSIDQHDTYGEKGKHKGDFFSLLKMALRALRAVHGKDDRLICSRMFELLDGVYKLIDGQSQAKKNIYDSVDIVGKTAIIFDPDNSSSSRDYLNRMGYPAVIYVDGNNIGLLVQNDLIRRGLRADHPEIKKLVEDIGEKDEWFAHPAGYLFCRGSRKSSRNTSSEPDPSELDPYDLAKTVERLRKKIMMPDN
jgi:hypothetical protein